MICLNQVSFFNGYWSYLEENNIPSAILHSWQEYPEHIASDVDYCIPQAELPRIIPLLNDYCEQSGWSLCQIFQHEKTAYFCVCASKSEVGDLIMLDVCGDYTVRGVRQVPAEIFIENREFNETKKFWVLNAVAELTYVLTKAAAKKKKPNEVMARVQELLSGMGEADRHRMAGCLPQQSLLSSTDLFDSPASYLLSSSWSQRIGKTSGSGWFEFVRKLKRVIQPTGFHIELRSTSEQEYVTAARILEKALGDTCRNTLVIASDNQHITSKDLILAKIKSTLIVSRTETVAHHAMMPKRFGVDLTIDLSSSSQASENTTRAILERALEVRQLMAHRTRRRWLNS